MKSKHLLFLLPLLFLAIFLFIRPNQLSNIQPPPPPSTINNPPSNLSYSCSPGQTAFDLLQQNAQIEFETSSYGKLVTKINNISQGDGKYWLYSIDGVDATVGADSYTCQANEQIVWQLK